MSCRKDHRQQLQFPALSLTTLLLCFVTLPGGLQNALGGALKCKASTGEPDALHSIMLLSKADCFPPVSNIYFYSVQFTGDERREEKKEALLTSIPFLTLLLEGKSQMQEYNRNKQYIVTEMKTAANVIAQAHTLGTAFYMLFLVYKHWCLMGCSAAGNSYRAAVP